MLQQVFSGLITILLCSTSAAGADKSRTESLQGLKSLFVMVEDLSAELTSNGLTIDQLVTDTELKMRLAGIQPAKSLLNVPGGAVLYVNVNGFKLDHPPMYVASILVEVRQDVVLKRDSNTNVYGATTFQAGHLLVTPTNHLPDIRAAVKDQLDRFLNAWLEANPKR